MLFTLIRNKHATAEDSGVLGYERIVVLAIEPVAIRSRKSAELGEWAHAGIACDYVCEADGLLTRFATDDLWNDIDAGIYLREGPPK
jgi:hypothetical protein